MATPSSRRLSGIVGAHELFSVTHRRCRRRSTRRVEALEESTPAGAPCASRARRMASAATRFARQAGRRPAAADAYVASDLRFFASCHDMHARSNFFSAASALFARDGILRALCASQPYAQSLVTCGRGKVLPISGKRRACLCSSDPSTPPRRRVSPCSFTDLTADPVTATRGSTVDVTTANRLPRNRRLDRL